MHPLDAPARKAGVHILLENKAAKFFHDARTERVSGLVADHRGKPVTVRAQGDRHCLQRDVDQRRLATHVRSAFD